VFGRPESLYGRCHAHIVLATADTSHASLVIEVRERDPKSGAIDVIKIPYTCAPDKHREWVAVPVTLR